MDDWQERNWFAVQAKPHCENLAAASVGKLDAEVLLPKVRQEQLICGVERLVTKPLFPGYLFAKFCPTLLLDAVRYARGVLRVVKSASLPLPVDEEIIFALRQRIQPDGFVRLETNVFKPGDQVTIEQGPFAGWMGQVEREWNDGRRVMILLEAIQKARLLVEKRWLSATEGLA